MATFKDLKRAAAHALRTTSKAGGAFTAEDRLGELVRRIETFAREDRTADRERAMRVSADGMYVRRNAGSYTSKTEGDQARQLIERLRVKAK
jgi:hypothetical protein